MNVSQDKYDLVARFLRGEMLHYETESFKEQLENDAELRELLALMEVVQTGVQERQLDATFQEWDQEYERKQAHTLSLVSPNITKWIGLAAAVILLLITGWWMRESLAPKSAQDLFASHYEPYSTSSISRAGKRGGQSTELFDQKEKGLLAYKNGNLPQAIEAFHAYLQHDSIDEDVRFFLGLSLLEQKNAQDALVFLIPLFDYTSSYHHQAQWYASLAYISLEDFSYASSLLEEIATGNRAKSNEAKEILKEIRRKMD